ncbi:hypothetical protein [Cellulomonas shaoxiangyii]|uniref:Uncharacterized protein n=1 Tax=Cellulomonas shaoxiangyii TaxID=2566013 RepID=A0A4P7SH87_9CELL|nr:hypothetical protein [Cellulomonas shaoxiangyii]QCB93320.1 hypothetical protein E5225_06910 [Cellulomonas shaoxiangyii]TGY79425.1 hypothetical protein E5226_15440 [Cellulomonas shaoxiangyii]
MSDIDPDASPRSVTPGFDAALAYGLARRERTGALLCLCGKDFTGDTAGRLRHRQLMGHTPSPEKGGA